MKKSLDEIVISLIDEERDNTLDEIRDVLRSLDVYEKEQLLELIFINHQPINHALMLVLSERPHKTMKIYF